ncbi:uncharacterized protein LOC117570345 [Drosophila albomicans]|uniref:Uncharacterized protein LOC117570345 n=1 Tax=Drosophila albomicans TaxID=7291 RepID=A0A6P8X7A6_DROAB|nr:uncharacterized protein LOC117570345 [Drosophila albomicans]
MSSANTTMYYSAVEDMFKDMLIDTTETKEQEMDTAVNDITWVDTPKRSVRIRRLNLFKDKPEFVICRRIIAPSKLDLSPRSQELQKEQQSKELLRLRRERHEGEQRPPVRRLTMRL